MEAYKIQETIGEGSFAVVSKATHIKTGEIVAIKKMRTNPLDIMDGINFTALREIKFLKYLKHPNVLNVLY